ncbi:hypothetical protein [Paenibacillus abyssi]|uniref:Uncharacterized protein n=1 Tax=Paenibacillus abyssi TaxID=1340531 RepID=A0A917CZZ6_9BACL|nr:hypothetical protein [Paenibacillus abyssi]GGG06373.1 hypothetical protein GCM10010916_24140 [Paenibacillus abyssi]
MLSFEEKLTIFESFPQLQRKDVSLGRVNFHYEDSAYDKKTVGYHLHPGGNGFVYAGRLQDIPTDDKGFVNIRDYTAEQLRSLIDRSIRSLTDQPAVSFVKPVMAQKERWIGHGNESLVLKYEDELWYVYAGNNLDCAFETREEAVEYLREEGFTEG